MFWTSEYVLSPSLLKILWSTFKYFLILLNHYSDFLNNTLKCCDTTFLTEISLKLFQYCFLLKPMNSPTLLLTFLHVFSHVIILLAEHWEHSSCADIKTLRTQFSSHVITIFFKYTNESCLNSCNFWKKKINGTWIYSDILKRLFWGRFL